MSRCYQTPFNDNGGHGGNWENGALVCVKGTFLCLLRREKEKKKESIKIASVILPAQHKKKTRKRREREEEREKTNNRSETTGKVFLRLSQMSLQILPFIVLSQCRALSAAISDCQCVDLAR